jgi:hypothetical protein
MLDAGWAKVLTDWLQFAIAGGIGGVASVWAVLSNREARRANEQESMGGRLAVHADRLTRLEHVAKDHLTHEHVEPLHHRLSRLEAARETAPSHEDLNRLHGRIDSVTSGLSEVRGELKGIAGLLRTIDLYLRHTPKEAE